VPDGTQVSKYLANHPRLDANFNIGLRINRLNVSLIADYIERQGEQVEAINASVNDEYLVGHAQVGYSFKNGLGLIFRMHNALDTDYQEILGAQMPGRWMMTGITWSINQD
jgi:iron complex outermembrane receptor protein